MNSTELFGKINNLENELGILKSGVYSAIGEYFKYNRIKFSKIVCFSRDDGYVSVGYREFSNDIQLNWIEIPLSYFDKIA